MMESLAAAPPPQDVEATAWSFASMSAWMEAISGFARTTTDAGALVKQQQQRSNHHRLRHLVPSASAPSPSWLGTPNAVVLTLPRDAWWELSAAPTQTSYGFTLREACQCLIALADALPDKNRDACGGKHGATALMDACFTKQVVVVDILLALGCDVSVAYRGPARTPWDAKRGLPQSGDTALHVVCRSRHSDLHHAETATSHVVELLLMAGADPRRPNAAGETPIALATQQLHEAAAERQVALDACHRDHDGMVPESAVDWHVCPTYLNDVRAAVRAMQTTHGPLTNAFRSPGKDPLESPRPNYPRAHNLLRPSFRPRAVDAPPPPATTKRVSFRPVDAPPPPASTTRCKPRGKGTKARAKTAVGSLGWAAPRVRTTEDEDVLVMQVQGAPPPPPEEEEEGEDQGAGHDDQHGCLALGAGGGIGGRARANDDDESPCNMIVRVLAPRQYTDGRRLCLTVRSVAPAADEREQAPPPSTRGGGITHGEPATRPAPPPALSEYYAPPPSPVAVPGENTPIRPYSAPPPSPVSRALGGRGDTPCEYMGDVQHRALASPSPTCEPAPAAFRSPWVVLLPEPAWSEPDASADAAFCTPGVVEAAHDGGFQDGGAPPVAALEPDGGGGGMKRQRLVCETPQPSTAGVCALPPPSPKRQRQETPSPELMVMRTGPIGGDSGGDNKAMVFAWSQLGVSPERNTLPPAPSPAPKSVVPPSAAPKREPKAAKATKPPPREPLRSSTRNKATADMEIAGTKTDGGSTAKPQLAALGCDEFTKVRAAALAGDDCGACEACKDKVKFGGPGRMKRGCFAKAWVFS